MTKKRGTFKDAILSSLEALIESGEAITKTAVIKNAKYKDGRPVGESTLYAQRKGKRGKKGPYVHADLHKKIDAAKEKQLKGEGKTTKKETIANSKEESARLRAENQKLVDAVVTQEAQLQQANNRIASKDRSTVSFESEIYTLARLVDHMSGGTLAAVSKTIIAFETKERGTARLKELEADVEELLAEITKAKTASIRS